MRVQEKDSESCAKMSEDSSMNGGPDIPSGSKRGCGFRPTDDTESPNLTADVERSSSLAGGRLKFFKDGKFILELSHRKEGERTSWVPVPKKTYWPPPGAAGTPRQESSTSLSVSDDNSSVQSSPWQRDHCWKQSTPRHNVNREMAFFMRPPQHAVYVRSLSSYSKTIRRKRRCPYDIVKVNLVESAEINNTRTGRRYKRTVPNPARLTVIVQTLTDKVRSVNASGDVASNNLLGNSATNCASTSRLDPSIVSPRKRILREMERVSLEDQANTKRQRARPGVLTSHATNNGSSSNCTVTCHTQVLPSPTLQSTSRGSVSNYSITSLLRPKDEAVAHATADSESPFLRTLLKSPPSPSVSPRPWSSASVKTSPPPAPSPPESHHNHRPLGAPSMSSSAHMPPFLTPGPSFLYPASYLPHHPYYSPLHSVPASYRGSPHSASPFWLPHPLSSREGIYPGLMPPCHPPPMSPCNWGPAITHHPLADMKRDDTCSDVPLNLSKHAG